MILVTGATGSIGREVVSLLVKDGEQVVAVTRHPADAALPADARVVQGDPSRPQTLAPSLGGVKTVFINPRALGDATAIAGPATAELLRLAAERGAERVVALSAVTVEFGGGYARFSDAFRAVEDAVMSSGLRWTILRCAEFDSNALVWAPQVRATGSVRGAYGDAASSPVHNRDVAAVSTRALLDASLDGHAYVLTGPQCLSQRERVHLIGEAIGKDVRWMEMSPDQVRADMLAQGVPEDVPDRLLGYLASLNERSGPISHTVEQLVGCPALTFGEWAIEHAAAFR